MKVEYINPFLVATINVLETMAFIKPRSGSPYLKKDDKTIGDITGIIGLTGTKKGSVSVSFSKECVMYVIHSMLGEEVKEIDDAVKDAVGELTNMISGDARKKLGEMGIILEAGIPSVVIGKGHTITHITKGPCIVIPFETERGNFIVEACFE